MQKNKIIEEESEELKKRGYRRKPQTKLIHKTLNPNTKLWEVIKNLVPMVLEFVRD